MTASTAIEGDLFCFLANTPMAAKTRSDRQHDGIVIDCDACEATHRANAAADVSR
jgi:Zn-finger protein